MDIISATLHTRSPFEAPVWVNTEDPNAGVLVVAVREDDFPPMIAVVDVQVAGRACHGETALSAMPRILEWAFDAVPKDWTDDEGALLVYVGPEQQVSFMGTFFVERIKWTAVKWPGAKTGTLRALCAAQPLYGAVLMSKIDELSECVS